MEGLNVVLSPFGEEELETEKSELNKVEKYMSKQGIHSGSSTEDSITEKSKNFYSYDKVTKKYVINIHEDILKEHHEYLFNNNPQAQLFNLITNILSYEMDITTYSNDVQPPNIRRNIIQALDSPGVSSAQNLFEYVESQYQKKQKTEGTDAETVDSLTPDYISTSNNLYFNEKLRNLQNSEGQLTLDQKIYEYRKIKHCLPSTEREAMLVNSEMVPFVKKMEDICIENGQGMVVNVPIKCYMIQGVEGIHDIYTFTQTVEKIEISKFFSGDTPVMIKLEGEFPTDLKEVFPSSFEPIRKNYSRYKLDSSTLNTMYNMRDQHFSKYRLMCDSDAEAESLAQVMWEKWVNENRDKIPIKDESTGTGGGVTMLPQVSVGSPITPLATSSTGGRREPSPVWTGGTTPVSPQVIQNYPDSNLAQQYNSELGQKLLTDHQITPNTLIRLIKKFRNIDDVGENLVLAAEKQKTIAPETSMENVARSLFTSF